ncbi:exostosin domain-containing protein [Carboxylicivirga linearis]|uniref:Exostosin family protein n=1 Tax=Carboxylicivirga linearis TaxID=1628157 RepID=A0ABS5JVZ3_9BACT|nr:exostosin family protein [Carboxylicivirga linearis]MBS2099074.1 exostosin family protein [Carboxylicivirga linearis]
MKVFIGTRNFLSLQEERLLVNFVRPLLNLRNLNEDELELKYGFFYRDLVPVQQIEEADFAVLPIGLNWYYKNHQITSVRQLSDKSKELKIPLLITNEGDFGVKSVDPENIIIRQSGYESHRLPNQHASTVFISDPVQGFFNGNIEYRQKGDKAKVGFCGQAASGLIRGAKDSFRTIVRNSLYYAGLSVYEPQVIRSSTRRRSHLLERLRTSDLVEDNFIIRDKYRAGANTPEERYQTTLEFYNNIVDSDYILCVRGGGNFSVRIYETLAMGRIPLFVNTDCVLPFDRVINWKEHVVWVDEPDMNRVDQILADFHANLHPDDFMQLQINNRELWDEYLSGKGFHKHLVSDIIQPLVKKGQSK